MRALCLCKYRTPVDGLYKHNTRDDVPLGGSIFFSSLIAAHCHRSPPSLDWDGEKNSMGSDRAT